MNLTVLQITEMKCAKISSFVNFVQVGLRSPLAVLIFVVCIPSALYLLQLLLDGYSITSLL